MSYYAYGLSNQIVWSIHLVVGAFLFLLGRSIINGVALSKNVGTLLIALGALVFFYHAHLWVLDPSRESICI